MKKYFFLMVMVIAVQGFVACSDDNDNDDNSVQQPETNPDDQTACVRSMPTSTTEATQKYGWARPARHLPRDIPLALQLL